MLLFFVRLSDFFAHKSFKEKVKIQQNSLPKRAEYIILFDK